MFFDFSWQAQCLVNLDNDTCYSAQCELRCMYDKDRP